MIQGMKFEIITIFPHIFDAYFSESIVGRALKSGLIEIGVHDLRDWSKNKHRRVDDTPYGGGAGMILEIEPIYAGVSEIKRLIEKKNNKTKTRVVLFSAKGKKYTQRSAERLAKYDNLVLICGRYEGVDERVAENIADEELSVGDYVLTGGELAAMIVVDSVSRLLPGVLGNAESSRDESFSCSGYLEYPQYTKPREFLGWKVPPVLLGGDHKKIAAWRRMKSKQLKSK